MKKILAIAISLVMVFAVAASAFAIFGFKASTTPILADNIKVAVQLYDDGTTTSGNSLILGEYPVHAPTSGVRAGDVYAFAVSVFIPDFDSMTAAGQALVDPASTDNGLTITTENLTDFAIIAPAGTNVVANATDIGRAFTNYGAPFTLVPDANFDAEVFIDNTALENIAALPATGANIAGQEYIFTAECTIATLADATVSAVYGAPDPVVGANVGDLSCLIGNWEVNFAASTYTMTQYAVGATGAPNFAGAPTGNTVSFAVGAADAAGNQAILDTFVTTTAGAHRVAQDPTTGDIMFIDATSGIRNVDFTEVTVLNATLTDAMGDMGFTWTPGGVLYDEGFEAIAARGLQFSASATFYAYTAALTVAGAATVPDTGDTMVVGIVMMAVAILATAAVVIRKVRA